MNKGFQRVLDYLISAAENQARQGREFERLMKAYFVQDPLYKERFSDVWLWAEWARKRPDFDAVDTGIDLVAREKKGGYCAIQCKCHSPNTRISKPALDSFIAASAREPFVSRMVVDTGASWGPNAVKTVEALKPRCQVLSSSDLAERPIDWPDLVRAEPEDLAFQVRKFKPRPHQRKAVNDVVKGFEEHDRGKMVMACGTGKTFTALRIAETLAGEGGRVLYLVPSISLFAQTMREWAMQRTLPHRYIGICSDTRAGRDDEDASLQELEIPVSTDLEEIAAELRKRPRGSMTAVFCTYQSLGLVEQAQAAGAPAFDLVLCDEAHRTTGVDKPGDKTSPFVLIHDDDKVRAKKRLYMTATPRLYAQSAKAKAARHETEVFSMDDEETYGPEFHCLPFSMAVEQDLLSDYKVVVLAISEKCVDPAIQEYLAADGTEINITDAAKIVGCWRALQNPENAKAGNGRLPQLSRAIAFTNTIKSSQKLEQHWAGVVQSAIERLPAEEQAGAFRCETQHVDGKSHALDRKARIDWLKGDSANACRVLSNARCLTEGIDVPALDAVLFMSPRNSPTDIVQAVGRAMRKSEGKKYGYIVLPVAVPTNVNPMRALDSNERYAVIWSVLRALRSHDDRFDAEINQIDLNQKPTERVIFSVGELSDDDPKNQNLAFPLINLPPDVIFPKIVEKCGDRRYWETWAKDVADIFARLVQRIDGLLDNRKNGELAQRFERFHEELRESINSSITHANAVHMMAQHILTRPVFEALFEQYDFAAKNPVAKSLDKLRKQFEEFGLEYETEGLESFYHSVRVRAQGLDNSAARQQVLMELYEKFFATAMKKDADRLGIVYTPVEVVDFILKSADHVLREEFGRSISDRNVHVLDPFTGTGIFLARLLQPELGLVKDSDLLRKYRKELHANEIVLLAYYIATVHIEEAFHGRRGAWHAYEPFNGIALTDTFNLHTGRTGFSKNWLPDNSKRVERQQKTPIQIIVGNPPWSTKQRSAADENPNIDYPEMEQRIVDTYARRSTEVSNRNSLYDTYKMAIRWASDRIEEEGIVAFVTNGSWIDGNADSGVRACLAEEFSSVYVLHLRGNARTSGGLRRREGDNVFGQGSRAPVTITLLIRNPGAEHDGCRICYRDIGDFLDREKKLFILSQAKSISGINNWQTIKPDTHCDWINQRSEAFQMLYPIGSQEVKAGEADRAVFQLYSSGYKTGRDAYIYNFSRNTCLENARKMVNDYKAALRELRNMPNATQADIDNIARKHSSNLRWDRELKNNLRRKKGISYQPKYIVKCHYRPFVKQYCYLEYVLGQMKYQMDRIFPLGVSGNRAICITGTGSGTIFSVLVTDTMPDLNILRSGSQCFPRYRYQQTSQAEQTDLQGVASGLQCVDNITDTALRDFRSHYGDDSITKDDIFDYVYGVLHAHDYQGRFAKDLAKGLPRVPRAENFRDFAEAGRKLSALHLGYETCEEVPLEIVPICDHDPLEIKPIPEEELRPEHFRIGKKKMGFTDTKYDTLRINERIGLRGIPRVARAYEVNGRSPLEWFIDRYRVTEDKESRIVNDPNDWFDDPRDIVSVVARLAHIGVESAAIIARLPDIVAAELHDFPYEPSRADRARRGSIVIATDPNEADNLAFIDSISTWSES